MISKIVVSLFLVLVFVGCQSSKKADDIAPLVKQAQLAFDNMADTTALELSEKACNLGSPDGCVLEGEIYRLGRGVKKDDTKAMSLFEIASGKGSVKAQYKLGKMYYLGKGIAANSKKAISYLEKSSLKGDLNSIKLLVFIYETSDELLKENQKASDYWRSKLPEEDERSPSTAMFDQSGGCIGEKVQTIGGLFQIINLDKVTLDGNIIDKTEYYTVINKLYSFKDKDIIRTEDRVDGNGYYDTYRLYTVLKDKTVRETPILGVGHIYKEFADDETIILKIRSNESDIDKTVVYEEGVTKVDGKTIAETGSIPYDFAVSNEWKPKFKQLLGKKYQTFLDNLGVYSNTTTLAGSSIVGSGMKPHDATDNQANFAVDFKNFPSSLKIYVVIREDGVISKYEKNFLLP
ncbi:tetratricopeptide repeat protein [Sulfuricurvum sp.]|uniref:tetratricopeptide repeat protein n=1 Tax=Sulfuricurvum sp. TaxID=2025608 RepID=UPI002D41B31B|nr:tetratricopeptide repeat protein [Sulfuricurvum sp.]HZF69753.1 tetratricopeptide repeat protein [Sulfuricurvum sp.]